ncbi:MAG: outer membrane beta-barrel protein, partial [Ignavibacteriaceae bacterium]|nr:outer membrane beta-barrel protein [Ignavibacteriaceae bacterium]MCU0414230.1 outer membrane beta-barrel protein [Ignavibacteriaceae bacterium]
MKLLKTLMIVAILSCTVFPQLNDTTYSLSTELGIGYSRFFTTMDYDKLNKNGFSGNIKVMWNPEHLLSIGLETGYQYLYSFNYEGYETEFGTTDLSASMYTIPVFIVISMKILPNIKLSAGSGMYLLFNSGEAFGENIKSNQISIGAHTGISYTYPINESMAVGGELLYSYFSKLQDQTVALQFLFV